MLANRRELSVEERQLIQATHQELCRYLVTLLKEANIDEYNSDKSDKSDEGVIHSVNRIYNDKHMHQLDTQEHKLDTQEHNRSVANDNDVQEFSRLKNKIQSVATILSGIEDLFSNEGNDFVDFRVQESYDLSGLAGLKESIRDEAENLSTRRGHSDIITKFLDFINMCLPFIAKVRGRGMLSAANNLTLFPSASESAENMSDEEHYSQHEDYFNRFIFVGKG